MLLWLMNLDFAARPGLVPSGGLGLTADPFLMSLIGVRTKAAVVFVATATAIEERHDFNPLLASPGKLMGRV